MSDVIRVDDLQKTYRTPLRRKKVRALDGISFSVEPGEVFGFLGPNGAGKTTTIRILMGLISASAGRASILGHPVPSQEARARLGFLPEAPYFYDYLTVAEVLDLAGRLFGLDRKERRRRTDRLIERVGLTHARDTALKKYSKGMLQRAGIAQALINDPELVVFDEPMGGLDPVGRREVRDIIEELRDDGKTVFFSSHILADVELVSDRVGILIKGKMRDIGTLSQLVDRRTKSTDIGFRATDEPTESILEKLGEQATRVRQRGLELWVELGADRDVDDYLAMVRGLGLKVISVVPKHETLEDLFIRLAGDGARAPVTSGDAGDDADGDAGDDADGHADGSEEEGA